MKNNKFYLGIDYGGNAVKVGLIDTDGNLLGKTSFPTKSLIEKADCRAFVDMVGEFVHGMAVNSSELGGAGLTVPGIFVQGNDDFFVPNVQVDWHFLLQCLKQMFDIQEIATLNDANAAALGEMWKGAGSDARSALLVTLGSGLGSGLIVDGVVVSGVHGAAGELGHMTVERGGRLCKCGREGCLERYASGRGMVQTFLEAGKSDQLDVTKFTDLTPTCETDALTVFQAYEKGDPRAIKALDVMTDKLGFALAQVACLVDPEVFLFGGGIAAGSQYYLDEVKKAYRTYCLDACSSTEIRIARLGGDAGMFGAVRYAMLTES